MMPRLRRSPEWRRLTPWCTVTRNQPRAPFTGRCRFGKITARPLLDEQDLAAGVVDADLTQHARHLERKGKRAVEVLVEAVVAAGLVAEQEGRRPRLPVYRAACEVGGEVRWIALGRAE